MESFPDDAQVVFTLPGAKSLYYADKLWTGIGGSPVLECEDAVGFEDVVGIAEQCLSEYEDMMSFEQGEALRDFTVTAEELGNEG